MLERLQRYEYRVLSGFWARYNMKIEAASSVAGSVFMRRFRLFLGQSGHNKRSPHSNDILLQIISGTTENSWLSAGCRIPAHIPKSALSLGCPTTYILPNSRMSYETTVWHLFGTATCHNLILNILLTCRDCMKVLNWLTFYSKERLTIPSDVAVVAGQPPQQKVSLLRHPATSTWTWGDHLKRQLIHQFPPEHEEII